MELTFSEILRFNQEYSKANGQPNYFIKIISNVTVNQLCPIMKYSLISKEINADVSVANFDNIVQDSLEFSTSDLVLLFWEMCNLFDGFQYKSNTLSSEELDQVIKRFKNEIDLVFNNLNNTKLVLINKFSTQLFNYQLIKTNSFDFVCEELNKYLLTKTRPNVVIINIEKIYFNISISKAINHRDYYLSKSLYTIEFYKKYSQFILPIISSILGKSKKALILDCDNTLWNGILGEDGEDGIEMSSTTKKGVYFEEIQFIVKELVNQGIIVGLNSKNNEADVDQVVKNHSDFVLKNEDIVIRKVNWQDKVSNLKEIASDLNIGIDSLVFIDDSDFEINLVNKMLPDVLTIKVPKTLHEYPELLRRNLSQFYNLTETDDDKKRIKSYMLQSIRENEKVQFSNIQEYLESLDLEITLFENNARLVSRLAQLTQKTNQFNLTTKRYVEVEIEDIINSEISIAYSINVNDKFGDFGITGVAIVHLSNQEAIIDSLLMSCRVLGRNIEIKFLDEIVNNLKAKGILTIYATFVPNPKNDQVKNFYDEFGFTFLEEKGGIKNYMLKLTNYESKYINFIRVYYER
jgi:FkbH-like protein